MEKITTKNLSEALSDMMKNVSLGGTFTPDAHKDLLSRMIDCPEEWGFPSEEVKEGAKFFQNIKSFLGIDAVSKIFAYQNFRDQVQKFQVKNGISATQHQSKTICGQTLNYIDYDDQLILLEEDLKILREQVPAICNLFLSSLSKDYVLFEQLDDESSVIATPEMIRFICRDCDYAWVHPTSHDWELDASGGYSGTFIDRDPPDEITLGLKWGDPENPRTDRYFKALILDRLCCGREYYERLLLGK